MTATTRVTSCLAIACLISSALISVTHCERGSTPEVVQDTDESYSSLWDWFVGGRRSLLGTTRVIGGALEVDSSGDVTVAGGFTASTLTVGSTTIDGTAMSGLTGTISTTGAVSGGSVTDGVATISSGALTGVTSVTASGTVQGGTLTDGTATITGGALTGLTGVSSAAGIGITANAFSALTASTTVAMASYNGKTLALSGTGATLTFAESEYGIVDVVVTATMTGDLLFTCGSGQLSGVVNVVGTTPAEGGGLTTATVTTAALGSWFRVMVDGTNCYLTGNSRTATAFA